MFRFIPAGDGSNGGLRTDACLEYDREVQVYGEEVREGNIGVDLAPATSYDGESLNSNPGARFSTIAKVFHPVPRIVKQKWRIFESEPFFKAVKEVLDENQRLREATADEELAKKIGEQKAEIDALEEQVELTMNLSDSRLNDLTAAQKEIAALKESVTALTAERDTLATDIVNLKAENFKLVGDVSRAARNKGKSQQ